MTTRPLIEKNHTVYALATAPGRAGVAVIRISGPKAGAALLALGLKSLPPPRMAAYRRFYSPRTGEILDHGLALYFKAPDSFTGEDVAELHFHGGRATAQALCEALASMGGLSPADPGEFTKRAFMNGKLDLTEAEAVADLVAAETAAQRRQALRQMDGHLGKLYDGWRTRLMRCLAHVEADIDFPDEDLPPGLAAGERMEIAALADGIRRHLSDNRRGERLRQGYRVAIIGAPNTGKSSLLNALATREAAIVSPIAGTTRDVIEVALDLGGYPVVLVDTAGLRDSADPIEQEGIRRARAEAEQADLRIVLLDAATPRTQGLANQSSAPTSEPDRLLVVNKSDLIAESQIEVDKDGFTKIDGQSALMISVKQGHGLGTLVTIITEKLSTMAPGDAPVLTRLRHREALESALVSLERSLAGQETDLIAEDLRHATHAIGRITGKIDVEAILDIVFRDFCIGK